MVLHPQPGHVLSAGLPFHGGQDDGLDLPDLQRPTGSRVVLHLCVEPDFEEVRGQHAHGWPQAGYDVPDDGGLGTSVDRLEAF